MSTDTMIVPRHLANTWDGTDDSIFDWWDKLRTLDDALHDMGKPKLLGASYAAIDLIPPHRSLLPTNPMGKDATDMSPLIEARRGFMIMGQAGARPQEIANWCGWTLGEVMGVMFAGLEADEHQKILEVVNFIDSNPNIYRPIDIRRMFDLTKGCMAAIERNFNVPLKPLYHPAWVGDTIRAKRKECPRMGATMLSRWFNENHTSPAGPVGRSAASKMLSNGYGD